MHHQDSTVFLPSLPYSQLLLVFSVSVLAQEQERNEGG